MTSRLVRRLALLLIAFYAFGQATAALAACGTDSGAMAQAMSMEAGDSCDGCAKPTGDMVGPVCIVHCNSDVQVSSAQPQPAPEPSIASLVVVAARWVERPPPMASLPPGALPRRILLHSFQV